MSLHDRTKQPMYLPQGGDPETVNLTSLFHPGMLGGRFINPSATQGNKEYQLVQVDSTFAATPVPPYAGATALWSDRDTYKVGTDVSALGRGNAAGIFTFAAAVGNYTCIQIRGRYQRVKLIDSPTAAASAAGLFVIPSATDGKADVLAAGTAATYPKLGTTAGVVDPSDQTCPVDLDVQDVP